MRRCRSLAVVSFLVAGAHAQRAIEAWPCDMATWWGWHRDQYLPRWPGPSPQERAQRIAKVAPVLCELLASSSDRDEQTCCLMALARMQCATAREAAPQAEIPHDFAAIVRPFLRHADLRSTAVNHGTRPWGRRGAPVLAAT
jgi:hypothetical protein